MNGLIEKRKERGLTQDELSDVLNIKPAALSHYETDKRFPSKETLKKMAQYFNCTIDELM